MRPFLLLFLLFAPLLHAAKLPDWAQPHLTPAALEWKKKSPEVILFDETEIHYQTPLKLNGVERSLIVIREPEEGKNQRRIFAYDTNSDKIITLAAWLKQPDGKVTSLSQNKIIDLPVYPSSHFWNNSRRLVLFYPVKLEPGSILAWEITYESKTHPIHPKGWGASSSIPLYSGRFTATPPPQTKFIWRYTGPELPPPTTDAASGQISWEISRFAPVKGGTPDGFYPTPTRIVVTCPTPDTPLSNWRDFAHAVDKFYAQTAVPTPELIQKATALTAGQTTRWQKIRALTDFIQSDVSYLSMDDDANILTGQIPQLATACLANRYGDCKDKANLLVSLLRAIGDQGHVLLLYSGNPTLVPSEIPLSSFNHAITAIPADADTPLGWPIATHPTLGRFVIVDTTSSHNPLGTLPIRDQAGLGLLIHPEGDIIRLPTDTPGHHGTELQATIQLLPRGNATFHLVETSLGQSAAQLQHARATLREKNFGIALEKRLSTCAPRIEKLHWNEATAENQHTLTLDCELVGFARNPSPGLLLVTLPTLSAPDSLRSWKTERPGQCWLPLEEHTSTFLIQLPEGTTLGDTLVPLDLQAGEIRATFTAKLTGHELRIDTYYLQPAGYFKKSDYETLRSLTQKYHQVLQRPILLKLPAK